MTEPRNMNRLKILYVQERDVLALIRLGMGQADSVALPCFEGLPPDVTVYRIQHDFSRRGFELMIASDTFPEVPLGGIPPNFSDPWKVRFDSIKVPRGGVEQMQEGPGCE